MYYININGTQCQVENRDSKIDELLSKNLRYKDQSIEFDIMQKLREVQYFQDLEGNSKRVRYLQHKLNGQKNKLWVVLYRDGEFGYGLLPRVRELLENSKLQYEIIDKRIKPKPTKMLKLKEPFPELRYYQKEAVKKLLEDDHGVLSAATGTGKSLTLCKMIWELSLNTMVITPNKAITDMMYSVLVDRFGKGKVARLNSKSKKLKMINVTNIQALLKIDTEVTKNIQAVFIDEFHRSSSDSYRLVHCNQLTNAYYNYGVTATPFRNDGSDMGMESVVSEIKYIYDTKKAVKDGFLVPVSFEIVGNKLNSNSRRYQSEYKDYIVNNKNRNNLVKQIVEQHLEDSVIILVKQMDHGNNLLKLIPNSQFVNGDLKDSDREKMMRDFRSGKLKCLIGTDKVLGEGVDLPIANVLIMANSGKAKSQVIQNVGRVLRIYPNKKEAIVYDFEDGNSRWMGDHFLQREEIYKEYY